MTQMLPKILPVNELKNTAFIMKTCKESNVPIVITRNGYGEAVMMSISLYEELFAKLSEALMVNQALDEIEKGEKGGQKLQEKAGRGLFFALFLFVGIPLPGTGAWTGTLAASFLDMDFKKSCVAVMAGVILAGIIMGIASAGVFGAAGAFMGAN